MDRRHENTPASRASMRFVTRIFFVVGRLLGGASSLFHNAAASTLTLAELKHGIRSSWQVFNDNRQSDVVAGLTPWEADLVDRFVKPGSTVVVAGCGSGRELLPLLARGCHVTGVDPASVALDVARRALLERQLSAQLIEGFIDDVQLPGQFDAIWFSSHCYCLIPGSARRIHALREAATHLNDGGHILVSYLSLPQPRLIAIKLARIVGRLSGSDWRLEAGDYVGWKRFEQKPYYGYLHTFHTDEIMKEAAAAGLQVVYRRDPPDDAVLALAAPRAAAPTSASA